MPPRRVLGQHCCPDPAACRPATRAVLASSCAPDVPRAGLWPWTDTGHQDDRVALACKVPSCFGFCWSVAWLGADQLALLGRPKEPGQMTIHDSTGVDCR